MLKTYLFFTAFLLCYNLSFSQSLIRGIVVDDQSIPITDAHVYFTGIPIGMVTDSEDRFELESDNSFKSFEVSYVGMKLVKIDIQSGKEFYEVILEEDNTLEEVVLVSKPKKKLKKKENPAYRILQKIWENKKKNGLKSARTYRYNRIRNLQVGLSNIDSLELKSWLKKDFDSLKKTIARYKNRNTYYLPIYGSQTVRSFTGDNERDLSTNKIVAKRELGVEQNGFIFQRIQNVFQDIDVYKNDIPLVDRTFVSPVSRNGYSIYHYVLKDSLQTDNGKEYIIYFFPIQDGDLAFEGKFRVSAKDFALTHIEMRTHPKINLNLVRNLFIEKSFLIKDSIFLPLKNEYEGDFTLLSKGETEKGLYVKQQDHFGDYELNSEIPISDLKKPNPQFRVDQYDKPSSYWELEVPKLAEDQLFYDKIQKVKDNRKIKKLVGNLTMITTGFVPLGKNIQLGSLWTTFGSNGIQGTKIKLGFRTFKTRDDRFRLQGYLSHGFRDESWNYGLAAQYLLGFRPRWVIGVSKTNDIQQMGGKLLQENTLILDQFANAILKRGDNHYLTAFHNYRFMTEVAIHKNLRLSVTAFHNNIESAHTGLFPMGFVTNRTIQSKFKDAGLEVGLRFTPNRRVYGFGVQQRFGRFRFPTTALHFKMGTSGILNGDFEYKQLQFLQNYPLRLSKFGILDVTMEAGKSFDRVPLPLLFPVPANQTFSLEKNTFALLNYYDYITDQYLNAHFEHHFNGLIMNRLPLLKKLNLRLLATFRVAYGTLSDFYKDFLVTNLELQAPDENPYYEYGIGLENLGLGQVRFFRLDLIWRGPHRSLNGPQSPELGFRLSVRPTF